MENGECSDSQLRGEQCAAHCAHGKFKFDHLTNLMGLVASAVHWRHQPSEQSGPFKQIVVLFLFSSFIFFLFSPIHLFLFLRSRPINEPVRVREKKMNRIGWFVVLVTASAVQSSLGDERPAENRGDFNAITKLKPVPEIPDPDVVQIRNFFDDLLGSDVEIQG